MVAATDFSPDWVSAPGDTITDVLAERRISVAVFAQETGQSLEEAQALLEGRATITIAIARRLQKFLGGSVEFWMARDFNYRDRVATLHGRDRDWLKELPLTDMIRLGWLRPAPQPAEEVSACLRFFDVPSVLAWRHAYVDVEQAAKFRTSRALQSKPGAVAAWLRQGEIQGDALNCADWDAKRFENTLVTVRTLTRERDPSRFLPRLRSLCAAAGVAVAVVRSPAGCRASGATRILPTGRALLLLSFRYLSDDHFWFTFFHEAGHLLLHRNRGLILENDDTAIFREEEEANDFAEKTLVPPERKAELLRIRPNTKDVIRFARRLGIAPGIVVGQLQYRGRIPRSHLNGLKRRFTWSEDH